MRIPASVQFGGVLEKALRPPVTPVDPEEILAAVVEKAISPESASERAKKAWEKRERAKPETPKPEAGMSAARLAELSGHLDQGDKFMDEAESAHTAGESSLEDAVSTYGPGGTGGAYIADPRQYADAIENFEQAANEVKRAAATYQKIGEGLPPAMAEQEKVRGAMAALRGMPEKMKGALRLLEATPRGPQAMEDPPGGNPDWEDVQEAGARIEAAIEAANKARVVFDDVLGDLAQDVHERTEPGTEVKKARVLSGMRRAR